MKDIVLSTKTYKLEQDPYIYQLQDTAEPELFRPEDLRVDIVAGDNYIIDLGAGEKLRVLET